MKMKVVNWKTTAAGAVTLLISVASVSLLPWLNGEPVSIAAIFTKENIDAAIGVAVGIGLLFSRDADKSSQDNGVRPLPPAVRPETDAAIVRKLGGK